MRKHVAVLAALALVALVGCPMPWGPRRAAGTFGHDLALLKEHTDVLVLSDAEGKAQVAVVPLYQGRVMTSTVDGEGGEGLGFVNRAVVAAGQRGKGITAFGGEDRFWLGPEGGPYSIYFKKGEPFDIEHWQTPEPIDWGGWDLVATAPDRAKFAKAMKLVNYSGTEFHLRAERTVQLLSPQQLKGALKTDLGPSVKAVAFESQNHITNTGKAAWKKSTGLLSIWILSMLNPSPEAVVVIPFRKGPQKQLGRIVTDAYFGPVPKDRIVIGDGVIFFKVDAQYRCKIGIPPRRALPVLGSYDPGRKLLTLAQYTPPAKGQPLYLNSLWDQKGQDPYDGDAAFSYNDGPVAPGAAALGGFYEIESTSPGAELAPGQTLSHTHRTIHLQGPEEELDPIAQATLGVSIAQIKAAFRP